MPPFYVASRDDVVDALTLITVFGANAGLEAQVRGDQSRERGNVGNFCRWRQIERLILVLENELPLGTLH